MDQLLHALLAYPTGLLTGGMAVAMLYWLLVIAGAVGFDGHDSDGHLGGDHDLDHDGAAGGHHSLIVDFLALGKVPVTITLSVWIFYAWALSLIGQQLIIDRLPELPAMLTGTMLLLGALLLGLIAAGVTVRPLGRLLVMRTQHGGASLIGRIVRVTSATADERFGTAVTDDADEMVLNVVAHGAVLTRDQRATVASFDDDRDVYVLVAYAHLDPAALGEGAGTLPSPSSSIPVSLKKPEDARRPVSLETPPGPA